MLDESSRNRARPTENPRNPNPAFKIRSLRAAQVPDTISAIAAVVRRINDQRVLRRIDFIQFRQQPRDGTVCVVDRPGVNRCRIIHLAILGDNVIRRRDRRMRLVEPDVEKERRARVTLFVQPRDRVVNDNLAGIPFNPADRLTVAEEVDRVFVARVRSAGHAEPVIKPVCIRGRFVPISGGQSQVPLAEMRSGIPVILQDLRQRMAARCCTTA